MNFARRLVRCTATAIVAATSLASAAAAQFEAPVWTVGDVTIKPTLSDRARTEIVDWFDPGVDGVDESYTFFANVIRFGAVAQRQSVTVTLEGQEVALFDLPTNAPGLGPGAVYYANTRQSTQREVHLRRGSLAWKVDPVAGLSVEGGRFLLNDGTETTPLDPSLAWIKKARVSQRLIGAFDYTHVGRSFDGGVLKYDRKPYNLTFSGGLPTAGGFNISANNHIGELFLLYAAATATEPEWLPRSDARLFYFYYADARDVVAVDNRPLPARQGDGESIDIHTIGANLAKVWEAGPGEIDVLGWFAGQTGSWQSQDHAAWALALEAGYRLTDVYGKPWLRLGWFRGSGDDDPDDGNHDTFFQGLPTARLYAQTPFYNLMNNQDFFVQAIIAPWEGGNLRADYHHLWVTEDADLVYSGGGATISEPLFGYSGFAANGHETLANFVDLSLTQAVTPRVQASVYYGHAFGGSVVDAQFPGSDQLDYGYVELTLSL
jgi:hypothetical protein